MESGLIIIGALVALAFVANAAKKRSVDGMDDNTVSIDNIRKGVARGWYTATLIRYKGQPAVRLQGRLTGGTDYADIYPISEADWQTLKNEGYDVAE